MVLQTDLVDSDSDTDFESYGGDVGGDSGYSSSGSAASGYDSEAARSFQASERAKALARRNWEDLVRAEEEEWHLHAAASVSQAALELLRQGHISQGEYRRLQRRLDNAALFLPLRYGIPPLQSVAPF